MSTTVRSFGFMALLAAPLTREQIHGEDGDNGLNEKLYDNKSGLNITYDGTIVYLDKNQHAPYSQRETFDGICIGSETGAGKPIDFLKLCMEHDLEIDASTITPYNSIWYNGSDSPMSMLEKAEFEQRAGLAG